MGLEIALEDERGRKLDCVGDPKNFLHRLLEPYQGKDSVLAEIDWYGDTTFNHLQIARFLSSWEAIIQAAKTPEEIQLLEMIKMLADQCESGIHLYLKFIGD